MTIAERQRLKRFYLKVARYEVRKRNWLEASSAYRSAAFHDQVLKALRKR